MPTQFVDDRDSAVVYSSGWGRAGSAPQEYGGTTRFAPSPGLTATLTFQGTMVAVYGTIAAAGSSSTIPPQTSYTVDGGDAATYTETMTRSVQYRQLFYQSPLLADGQHTLVITNLIQASGFFLDYFVVTTTTDDTTTTTTGTAISTTASTTTGGGGGGATVSSRTATFVYSSSGSVGRTTRTVATTSLRLGSGSASASLSLPAPTSSVAPGANGDSAGGENHTGTIVGGTIGAIGCLLLLVAIILVLRRQRAKKAPSSSFTTTPTPYDGSTGAGVSFANFHVHSDKTTTTTTTTHSSYGTSDNLLPVRSGINSTLNAQAATPSHNNNNNQPAGSPPAYVAIHPPTYMHERGSSDHPYGLHPEGPLPSKLRTEGHRA